MPKHPLAFRGIMSGTARCVNARRPLTHLLELGERGLAVKVTRQCSIEGCPDLVRTRGWCSSHYYHWQKYGDPLAGRPSQEERFWAKVSKKGPIPKHCPGIGECWIWTAACYPSGYGMFYLNGRLTGAHVASWILAHSPVPRGLHICHHCDNHLCVRPDHLFIGTRSDNMRDMHSKGRGGGRGACGERNGHAKLTGDQVLAIRHRFDAGERGVALATEFGITQNIVSRVVTGASWRHVGGPIRSLDHPRRAWRTRKETV